MRYVTLAWVADPPAGYDGLTAKIPVLTPATFTAWILGGTGTYLDTAVRVVGRTAEVVK